MSCYVQFVFKYFPVKLLVLKFHIFTFMHLQNRNIDFYDFEYILSIFVFFRVIQVRDFEYCPETQQSRKQELEQLVQDQTSMRNSLLQWCYTSYGEVCSFVSFLFVFTASAWVKFKRAWMLIMPPRDCSLAYQQQRWTLTWFYCYSATAVDLLPEPLDPGFVSVRRSQLGWAT